MHGLRIRLVHQRCWFAHEPAPQHGSKVRRMGENMTKTIGMCGHCGHSVSTACYSILTGMVSYGCCWFFKKCIVHIQVLDGASRYQPLSILDRSTSLIIGFLAPQLRCGYHGHEHQGWQNHQHISTPFFHDNSIQFGSPINGEIYPLKLRNLGNPGNLPFNL